MRPIFELLLCEDGFEQLESGVLVRVAFHVEINESADLSRAAQKWSQLGREMGNCIRWIGRIYLRIERRNFDRQIYNWKELRIFAQRVCPVFCFPREFLEQIQITRRVFIRVLFAHDGFSQQVDSKADFLRTAFAQRFYYVVWIFSGDKLVRHSGNIPPQDWAAHPGNDACQTNAGANKRPEAVIGEILVEMLDNFAGETQLGQNIDKAK